MAVTRMYVPAPGQSNANGRAHALDAGLSVPETADAPRYAAARGQLPAVILENGNQIVIISEPTSRAAVDAAAAELEALTPVEEAAPPPPFTLTLNEEAGLVIIEAETADGTKTGVIPLT